MRILWLVPGAQIGNLTPCSSLSPSVKKKKKKCCGGQMKSWIGQHKGNSGKSYRYTCIIIASTPIGECSGGEAIKSPGPGCNSAEGTAREEVLRAARCRPAVDCALSTSSAVDAGSRLYCAVMCKLRPSFTYHFSQRSAWTISIHACSAGSKLREKQQLRWKECPKSPLPGICSCSSSVFCGSSFLRWGNWIAGLDSEAS